MHHQKRNKHHPEYWTTVGIYEWSNGGVEMPDIYVREWVADLLGASMEYTGSYDMEKFLKEAINKNKWGFSHQNTLRKFSDILRENLYPVYFDNVNKKLYWFEDRIK